MRNNCHKKASCCFVPSYTCLVWFCNLESSYFLNTLYHGMTRLPPEQDGRLECGFLFVRRGDITIHWLGLIFLGS